MRPRVRRDPIDLVRLSVELAETTEPGEPEPFEPEPTVLDFRAPEAIVPEPLATEPVMLERSEDEIVAALEAEVIRAAKERETHAAPPLAPPPGEAATRPVGLPLDQVRAWLEQVKDDLRKVQARLQYLEVEQTRLQGQHHLVAELISTSSPV